MRHDAAPLDTACIYCGTPGQRIPYQQACFAGKDVWLEGRWFVICMSCIDDPVIPTTFPFKHVRP